MTPKYLLLVLLTAGCVSYAPRNADIGAAYLGARYLADPLGEGRGYDADPLIRDDAFDCVTFVETALARGDADALRRIRYRDGVVAFETRNHFVETDWLDANADMFKNVSGEHGTTAQRHVVVDKNAWARATHGVEINAPVAAVDIEYLPYEKLGAIRNRDALIVLFIAGRDDAAARKLGTDIAVKHVGFLLPGGMVLRHASSGRGVVDDDFAQYVEKRRHMRNNIGIALVKIK